MPLVMLSSCLIVTLAHCGYWGSQCPTVSSIDSRCSASSRRISTEVNAFVLLPICTMLSAATGRLPPNRVVPAARSMVDGRPRRLTLSTAAETCSGWPRSRRYPRRSSRRSPARVAVDNRFGAASAWTLVATAPPMPSRPARTAASGDASRVLSDMNRSLLCGERLQRLSRNRGTADIADSRDFGRPVTSRASGLRALACRTQIARSRDVRPRRARHGRLHDSLPVHPYSARCLARRVGDVPDRDHLAEDHCPGGHPASPAGLAGDVRRARAVL